MTSKEFNDWMVEMGQRVNKERLSEREASFVLGWSRAPIRRVLAGHDAPKYIGLACRAIANGDEEWKG